MPGGGGPGVYSHDILAGLKLQGFDVHVLSLEPCILEARLPWIWDVDAKSGFHNLAPGYVKMGRRLWSLKGTAFSLGNKIKRWFKLSALPQSLEATWGNPLTSREAAQVCAASRKKKWDAVVCNYCWLSGALDFFDAQTRKAVLTHDVWHKHVARQSDNNDLSRIDHEAEARLLGPADIIIAITENDAADFRAMLPGKTIVCAPMSCRPAFSSQAAKSGALLFVGSAYRPNVEGVTWFLNQVGPILERQMPGYFHLNLVGAVGEALPACDPSLIRTAKGRVGNLSAEYARAEIVIVPILAGTGLKIKLVEAIAHGKAIVTTTAGAQGLENLAGQAFAKADQPEQFAERIMEIATDASRRACLENAAKTAAQKNFSPESCCALLARVLAG